MPALSVAPRSALFFSLRPWLIFFFLQAILILPGGQVDTFLWRSTRWLMGSQDSYVWERYRVEPQLQTPQTPWYQRLEPPLHGKLYKRSEQLWRLLRDFGEPHMVLLVAVLVGIYHPRRRWLAVGLLIGACAGASLLGEVIRCIAGRWRPDHFDGQSLWALGRGFYHHQALSFPSGHTLSAFAMATVLAWLSPPGRWFFFAIAGGCGLVRIVMQAHFPSDVLAGAWLGVLFADALIGLALRAGLEPSPQQDGSSGNPEGHQA